MNTNNSVYFLLQRYLETISTTRESMNSMHYAMLNTISEQERNVSSLLYHYIDSMRIQDENNNTVTSQFTRQDNFFRNRRHRSDIQHTAANHNRTRQQERTQEHNRNRPHIRPRTSFSARTNPADEVWGSILNFANQPIFQQDLLRPVIVRPTLAQIQRATEVVNFSAIENPRNSICSITQEEFQPNDRVTRILYCGHTFFPEQIREWFRQNVRCPVCRYDIRTYRQGQINGDASNANANANADTNTNANTNANANANANADADANADANANADADADANANAANANADTEGDNRSDTNIGTNNIMPPDSLAQLAQTISTELASAFRDIAPNNINDITIEYGMFANPNHAGANHTDASNSFISNRHDDVD